jgi:hypothetical protein
MLDPCTVSIAEPVPAWLTRRNTRSPPMSTDHPWLALPSRCPAVITTRRVALAPCPTRHRTDVSDCHCVPSHPVCPWRIFAVYETIPMLDPCTIIDADPVPAWLACRRNTLIACASIDKP